MAQVDVQEDFEIVERIVREMKPVTKYVLTLTELEAETLNAMTGKIGGDPRSTYRGVVDGIRTALLAANVDGGFMKYFDGHMTATAMSK